MDVGAAQSDSLAWDTERQADWGFSAASKKARWVWVSAAAVAAHALLALLPSPQRAAPDDAPPFIEAVLEEAAVPAPREVSPKTPAVEPAMPSFQQKHPATAAKPVAQPSASAEVDGARADASGDGADGEEAAAPIALGGEQAGGWEMLSGSGTSLRGGSRARIGARAAPSPTRTLAARDLSRDAKPPDLQPLVQKNFPVAARMSRVGGTVTVSAVILPDGTPTDVRVVRVSPRGRGFGETCSRTVHEGPDWKPRLNRDGRPVSAQVRYTCRFLRPEAHLDDVEAPTTGTGANRVWTRPAGR